MVEQDERLEMLESIAYSCDQGLISASELISVLIWGVKDYEKWLAAAAVLGWACTITLLIVCPPVGALGAILAVMGFNFTTFGFGFGLGVLFGGW